MSSKLILTESKSLFYSNNLDVLAAAVVLAAGVVVEAVVLAAGVVVAAVVLAAGVVVDPIKSKSK